MKKFALVLSALILAVGACPAARAYDFVPGGYANDSYASQIALDAFNLSVRKRMEAVRVGSLGRSFASAPILRSDEAYAMAPSSRTASVSRRQLDCVYYNGFTVWGDFYTAWASQDTRGGSPGYKYRATAPAIGLDWSTGNFTVGLATTYNWGKLKSKSYPHDQKVRTWALDAYAQWDCESFYVNTTLGYGYNRFRGSRPDLIETGHTARYHSNAFNIDAEFGMKFNFGGFQVVPHVGARYFHDRRGAINESNPIPNSTRWDIHAGRKNYHTLEIPIGVNLGYNINVGGALIVPQLRFAWIPELARRRGNVSGYYWNDAQNAIPFSINSPRRGRHAFQLGAGVEAKITKSISAHIDYNVIMRTKSYQHHLNFGVGFTF